MIKLKFKVLAFYFANESYRKYYKEYNIEQLFDEKKTFEEILLFIHKKYKIDNGLFDNYFVPFITQLFWQQYFSKELCYFINIKEDTYLKATIKDLEKQFKISQIEIPVYLNYDGIGRAIGEKEGIKLLFHFDEKDRHHRPHIHCEYAGDETRVEIETLKVLDKPFKKSKMDIINEIITNNKEELLNYWNRAIINGEPIKLNIDI